MNGNIYKSAFFWNCKNESFIMKFLNKLCLCFKVCIKGTSSNFIINQKERKSLNYPSPMCRESQLETHNPDLWDTLWPQQTWKFIPDLNFSSIVSTGISSLIFSPNALILSSISSTSPRNFSKADLSVLSFSKNQKQVRQVPQYHQQIRVPWTGDLQMVARPS